MNNSKLYLGIFVAVAVNFLFSGTDGTLRGSIKDVDGAPIIGAQIYASDISKGTTSDLEGNFISLSK